MPVPPSPTRAVGPSSRGGSVSSRGGRGRRGVAQSAAGTLLELESFLFGVSGSREAVSATVKDALMGSLEARERVLAQTAARGPEMMPPYRPETGFQSHD